MTFSFELEDKNIILCSFKVLFEFGSISLFEVSFTLEVTFNYAM